MRSRLGADENLQVSQRMGLRNKYRKNFLIHELLNPL
jgi:hypothetical protein